MELLRELNRFARSNPITRPLRSPSSLPTLQNLETHLRQKFGNIKIRGSKRTVTVSLPWYDVPEKVEDIANRVLRAFGLEYTDLTPGKPGGLDGKTGKFTIYGPELNRTAEDLNA